MSTSAPNSTAAGELDYGKLWLRRPLLSLGLRATVFLVPVSAGVVATELLSHLVSAPRGDGGLLAWWVMVSLGGLAVLLVVERLMRRLLPLAALLNVSLLFPDHAPRRFAVARRSGRPDEVVRRLRREEGAAASGDLLAAQQVLELTAALSVHDRRTRGHSERVRVLTDMISAELRLPEHDRARLRWSALLHDIGKLTVSRKTLNKSGRPDEREWKALRAHPEQGARLLAPVLPWLGEWGLAVVQHHEWYDGSGYPRGLKGAEISLGGRIVSVADVYETLTAPRPYRLPVSISSARAELVRVSGSQLDPVVVRAFLNVSAGRLWSVLGVGAALSQLPLVGELSSTVFRVAPGLASTSAAAGAAGALAITGGAAIAPLSLPHGAPSTASTPKADRGSVPAQLVSGPLAGSQREIQATRPSASAPRPPSPAVPPAGPAAAPPPPPGPKSPASPPDPPAGAPAGPAPGTRQSPPPPPSPQPAPAPSAPTGSPGPISGAPAPIGALPLPPLLPPA